MQVKTEVSNITFFMKDFPEIFSIIDTETTGMRPPFSRIIDIGIIRVEHGKEIERYQTLINPGTAVPWRIEGITGISSDDLVTAPSFEEVALQIRELLEGSVFVAHNAPFDYSFVKSEFSRIGMPFTAETLCSVRLSRALSPKARSHNLDSIIDRYGIQLNGERHRALPDADAVWEFFKRANAQHSPSEIRAAVARARAGGSTPAIARDTFTDLPDSAGVYFFYGPEQELLYIGKSKHVRTRARSHFHTSDSIKEKRIQRETNTISSVRTSGELSALLLESALIKTETPLYNRALRKRKLLVLAQEGINENGYQTLTLERKADFQSNQHILSVFRTISQAKVKIRELAREYKLCHTLLGIETSAGACFGYQLDTCLGACAGKESADAYNARFIEAFTTRRLRIWPYAGTVLIDERSSENEGTAIFIHDWIVLGAYTYEGETYSPLFLDAGALQGFEYDTYKILVRYLRNPKNKRTIRVLGDAEYKEAQARITGEDIQLLEETYVTEY
jgi:DNA polymerase-3 subunit epsilon